MIKVTLPNGITIETDSLDDALTLTAGLVRHGSHRRVWVITAKGWNSKFRVTQPIRKDLP